MYRSRLDDLSSWLISEHRKPLVIRGARQTGKTWLAKALAETHGLIVVELNFEKKPRLADLFASNDPQSILFNLSTSLDLQIDPHKSLLLLDEIQAAPEMLAKLRWFAEDMPQLPVIATGSLLEFVLEEHTFSMPVGRINYMHLEPMSFAEFLMAHDKARLVDYLKSYELTSTIPTVIHDQLTNLFREYVIIGGLPASVKSWVSQRSLEAVHQIQHELLATYRDDFPKYSKRIPRERLDEVMLSVPKQLGTKFVYTQVNPDAPFQSIRQALALLNKARICHPVTSSAANGIPLGVETREKYVKEIFIDIGLCSVALGYSLNDIHTVNDLQFINKGALAEQITGQLLRTISPYYVEPELFCWAREEKGSSAEVDYLIQHGHQVVPVEVKAGKTGTLKSLHLLMGLKNLPLAVRVNADIPTVTQVNMNNSLGVEVNYKLLSVPFYLLEQLHRLISTIQRSDTEA